MRDFIRVMDYPAKRWYMQTMHNRITFEVDSIDQCKCIAEEVFFGFIMPASMDNPSQTEFDFNG